MELSDRSMVHHDPWRIHGRHRITRATACYTRRMLARQLKHHDDTPVEDKIVVLDRQCASQAMREYRSALTR